MPDDMNEKVVRLKQRFNEVAKELEPFANSFGSSGHFHIPVKWTTTPAEYAAAEGLIEAIQANTLASKKLAEVAVNSMNLSAEAVAKSAAEGR